ncbi:hypothetical protein PVAP13_4KG373400 [Panicum virgatum]|uniref:Uncharacterized protein n=1 Tax=Panicum virgatum TaxID=38727 RepID=A0A8T0TYL9_PANVG|nr:hypothetical protein PVAP13_4KG373400 [Panicum virgatum]
MRHPTSAATPPGSPAPPPLASPKSSAIKRQRKAAAPLGDVTNLLLPDPAPLASPKSAAIKRQRKAAPPLGDVTNFLLPETPTPIKPRRTGLRPLPTPSDSSSTCFSTASVTPAPQPSSAAVLEEERSAVKSPISTVYARRGTTETQGRRNTTTNPTTTTKGKEPIAAAGTASCPPLGRATRKNSSRERTSQMWTRLNCLRKRFRNLSWSER